MGTVKMGLIKKTKKGQGLTIAINKEAFEQASEMSDANQVYMVVSVEGVKQLLKDEKRFVGISRFVD